MIRIDKFKVGGLYSRKDIYRVLGVPKERQGGNWNTGYTTYDEEVYIFVNVDTPGRTGHDYGDKWMADGILFWHGKTHSHKSQPLIREMILNRIPCHVFTRNDNSNVKFTYQGIGIAVKFNDKSPVEIFWKFDQG